MTCAFSATCIAHQPYYSSSWSWRARCSWHQTMKGQHYPCVVMKMLYDCVSVNFKSSKCIPDSHIRDIALCRHFPGHRPDISRSHRSSVKVVEASLCLLLYLYQPLTAIAYATRLHVTISRAVSGSTPRVLWHTLILVTWYSTRESELKS